MEKPIELQDIIKRYLEAFPDEASKLANFPDYLSVRNSPELMANYLGYVTASAFVILKQNKQVLLLGGGPLQFFLRPTQGAIGQIDQSMVASFRHQLEEEIGFAEYQDVPLFSDDVRVPLDVEIQPVPAALRKQNAPQEYYNFRYAFMIDNRDDIELDVSVDDLYQWKDWEEFKKIDVSYARLANKVENLHVL